MISLFGNYNQCYILKVPEKLATSDCEVGFQFRRFAALATPDESNRREGDYERCSRKT
jgi:hypothetical protein